MDCYTELETKNAYIESHKMNSLTCVWTAKLFKSKNLNVNTITKYPELSAAAELFLLIFLSL